MTVLNKWLGEGLGKLALALALASGLVAAGTPQNQEPFQQEAYQILRDSIAMRTVEGYANVPQFAHYLEAKLTSAGFSASEIKLIPVGETMALVARYPGDGRLNKKPILLSAHMDVVEAKPEDWERNPYELIEDDGYLFGRGVSDNKFGVAMLVASLMRLRSEGYIPGRDIVLALSGDEETSMVSTKLLAHQYRDLIDAEFALVADGGGGLLNEEGKAVSFTVDSAEKTYADFRVTARNPGGHSSLPRKDNAIYDLAQGLVKLAEHDFPVLHSELTRSYLAKSASLVGGDIAKAMESFAKDPSDREAIMALRATPEYVGTTGTTCVATLLDGGHALNALPQSASANINCRIFPGVGVKATLNQLQEIFNNSSLKWEILDDPIESDASPLRKDIFDAIEHAVHADHPGLPVIPHMASGASDAMHFRAVGIPSYTLTGIFMKSSDEYAHGLNERVPADSLPFALRMWNRLIVSLTE